MARGIAFFSFPHVMRLRATLHCLSFRSAMHKRLQEHSTVIAGPCCILGRRKSRRKSHGRREGQNVLLRNALLCWVASCSPWMRWHTRGRTLLWQGLPQRWGCKSPCSIPPAAVSRPTPRTLAPRSSTRPARKSKLREAVNNKTEPNQLHIYPLFCRLLIFKLVYNCVCMNKSRSSGLSRRVLMW